MFVDFIFIKLQLCRDVELNPGPTKKLYCTMYNYFRGLHCIIRDLQVSS